MKITCVAVVVALCAKALFAVSPGDGAIRCGGVYGGHLQGVATNRWGTDPAERAFYRVFRDFNPLTDLGIG